MPCSHSTMARRFPCSAILAGVLCLFLACGGGNGNPAVVTVFAAASLTDAFNELALDFESSNPEIDVRMNFAGSQRLRSQLELGARADIFASADELQMDLASEAGLLRGEPRRFAKTSMAVIAYRDSGIDGLQDLAEPGVRIVLAHAGVPAGQYSRDLLSQLSEDDSTLGEDFAERVLANVVSEETSVKFVEQKVALGQADAGIVYRPGAMTAKATGSAIELPLSTAAAEVRASYVIAATRDAEHPGPPAQFMEFAMSGRAQEIFASYGFDPP